jgi:5-methylcytosine-specific restriction enzyme subunit McrC
MLQLTEHTKSEPKYLTASQQRKLKDWFQADFEPTDETGKVHVIPGSRVGGATIDGLKVSVAPKIPVHRLLTIIAETADPYRWFNVEAATTSKQDVDDALAALFVRSCQQTFESGMHRSYRRERQQLGFVRGKLLLPQTIRQFTPVPVTVETDVFDEDTPENQVLAAALQHLRRTPSLAPQTRQNAHHVWRNIKHVQPLRDPLSTAQSIVWTRHNQWYRQAVSLAVLLLSFGRVHHDLGLESIPGFVIDMPLVIEQWVRVTLRTAWGLTEQQMPDSWKNSLWLDQARRVELQPDLAVRNLGRWSFVGDVKYKILPTTARNTGANRNDIYQMLAYLTATGLTDGVLIYAGTEGSDEVITVGPTQQKIRIISLDLSAKDSRSLLIDKLDSAIATAPIR